jgi:hypothetical protein
MKLKRVVFFDKDGKDDTRRCLLSLVQPYDHPEKSHILQYLRAGKLLFVRAGWTHDYLDPDESRLDGPNTLTDGCWACSSDLAYYV